MTSPHPNFATPPDVTAWSGLALDSPLTGGVRNPVWGAHRGTERLVVRCSGRTAAALDWELDLLAHLDAHGVGVPVTVPADDGRRHVDGVMVQRFVAGHPPDGPADWRSVVATVTTVHELTTAGLAWEVATCWAPEPAYAARRLVELRQRI